MRFVGSIPRLDDTVILLSKGITTTRVEVIYNMCGHYRGKYNYGTITYGDCIETRYYYYRYYPYGSTDLTFCLYRYRCTASTSVRWYTADYMQGWLNKP